MAVRSVVHVGRTGASFRLYDIHNISSDFKIADNPADETLFRCYIASMDNIRLGLKVTDPVRSGNLLYTALSYSLHTTGKCKIRSAISASLFSTS